MFHDDQHGTAVVVLAALRNAAALLDRKLCELRVVVSGAGAAGVAVTQMLIAGGVDRRATSWSTPGASSTLDASDLTAAKAGWPGSPTPPGVPAASTEALRGADVLIGVSGGTIGPDALAGMAPGGIIFALANPTPEVHPEIAARYAAVVATGRSDFPNQINNVLAFPGIFRGALDARARTDHRRHEARRRRRHRRRRRRRAAPGRHRARARSIPGWRPPWPPRWPPRPATTASPADLTPHRSHPPSCHRAWGHPSAWGCPPSCRRATSCLV